MPNDPLADLPPLAPGEALATVQRVARQYTLVACACPPCGTGVRARYGPFCGLCQQAGCTATQARCPHSGPPDA